MKRLFQTPDVSRLLSETPHRILAQIQAPDFLVQAALVVLGGLMALWLSRLARGPLNRWAARRLPPSWAAGFLRIVEHVLFPLHWLAILWIGVGTGMAIDLKMPLTDAAIDLVFAWICIRLLSFAVKSHAVSVAISLAAWSVAALSILDLYRPLVNWLRRVPVFETGSTHVSLLGVVNATIVLIVLLWLTQAVYRVAQRRIGEAASLSPSLQALLFQLLKVFLPVIAVVIALQTVGVDLTTLTVAFGAVGLGIGLGLQKMVSNFVSGMSLIVGKTIKPGDVLKFGNTYGTVTAMGARYVTLRTLGGIEHLIPNDYFVENGVENWSYTDAALCLTVSVGISYDGDPHRALALAGEAAVGVARVKTDPAPLVHVREFGDSAIVLDVMFWIDDPSAGTANVKSEVLLAIWDRFKAAGIAIPFPQRDVHILSMPTT
jgi:small-conductance mechanosensitive channel